MRKYLLNSLTLALCLFSAHAFARHARGGLSSAGGGGASLNAQVSMMGISSPANTNGSSPNAPNASWIAWECDGSSTYSISRATNGGSYISIVSGLSAATAASNYTTYLGIITGAGGGGPTSCASSNCTPEPASGVNCAYNDTAATAIVGTNIVYGILEAAASITGGSNVLTITSSPTIGTVTVGQGVAGSAFTEIPIGTTINTFGSGGTTGTGSTGTYQMSASTTSGSTQTGTIGTVFNPSTAYTYYVTSSNGNGGSGNPAYLPFITNGGFVESQGVFNNAAALTQVSAPGGSTPLGNAKALAISFTSGSVTYINPYAGNSTWSQRLSIGGYNYVDLYMYSTTANLTFVAQPERVTDQNTLTAGTLSIMPYLYSVNGVPCGGSCPSTIPASQWVMFKIPTSAVFTDQVSGASNALQTNYYKISYQYNYGSISSAIVDIEEVITVN